MAYATRRSSDRWKRIVGALPGGSGNPQVRVLPTMVEQIEHYTYRWELGQLRQAPGDSGAGVLEVHTRSSDPESFGPLARADIERVLRRSRPSVMADTGFLRLHNHQRTSLEHGIPSAGRYESLPLRRPLNELTSYEDQVKTGLVDIVQRVDYEAVKPDLPPVSASVTIQEDPEFRHGIGFKVTVSLKLPRSPSGRIPEPVLDELAIEWPWITDPFDALLAIGEEGAMPCYYDTARRCLVVVGPAPILMVGASEGFTAHELQVPIALMQPLQLTGHPVLTSHFTVVIEDYLLSGAELALYSATGDRVPLRRCPGLGVPDRPAVGPPASPQLPPPPSPPPPSGPPPPPGPVGGNGAGGRGPAGPPPAGHEPPGGPIRQIARELPAVAYRRRTVLEATAAIDLSDTMSHREIFLAQNLRFRGIEPRLEVLEAIFDAIQSSGFGRDGAPVGFSPDLSARYKVHKRLGGHDLEVTVEVTGEHREMTRVDGKIGQGPVHKEKIQLGDIEILVQGRTTSSHQELTREMNLLHRQLRSSLDSFMEAL